MRSRGAQGAWHQRLPREKLLSQSDDGVAENFRISLHFSRPAEATLLIRRQCLHGAAESCDVKMERSRNTGIISCTVCLEEFQTPITYLSEPVDVYSDWIDACEAANQ
ncbi:transcription elongation factor 1 homolog [Arapaima gigas]